MSECDEPTKRNHLVDMDDDLLEAFQMTTEPKLTDEQVEFLDKLMEWEETENAFTMLKRQEVRETADFREAVMDRAVEEGWIKMTFFLHDDENYSCQIVDPAQGKKHWRTGPTRFIALINALMEAER